MTTRRTLGYSSDEPKEVDSPTVSAICAKTQNNKIDIDEQFETELNAVLEQTKLPPEQKRFLKIFLYRYQKALSSKHMKYLCGVTSLMKCHLDTGDSPPIKEPFIGSHGDSKIKYFVNNNVLLKHKQKKYCIKTSLSCSICNNYNRIPSNVILTINPSQS